MQAISASELAQWLADGQRPQPLLLDVREPWEVALCMIPGSITVPMAQVPGRHDELDRQREIVCICHHSMRSRQVAMYLAQQGFGRLFNLSGGIHAWAQDVDASMTTY